MVRINQVTGNLQQDITVELVSVSDIVLELNNEKRTKYHPATVKLPSGKVVRAIMYDENFKHGVAPGDSLLATVEDTGNPEPFITVSHLVAAQRATVEDFDWSQPAEAVKIEDTVAMKANG